MLELIAIPLVIAAFIGVVFLGVVVSDKLNTSKRTKEGVCYTIIAVGWLAICAGGAVIGEALGLGNWGNDDPPIERPHDPNEKGGVFY